jgi:SAM-dependent methyltransferase
MSSCCQTAAIADFFGADTADDELKRYRKEGPLATTRALVCALRQHGVDGATVLDIGGGVGAVHHALLEAGASSVVHVDLSSAYLDASRAESARRGYGARVTHVLGDFVAVAPTVGDADVVTLDRVICCYPELGALVRASARRSRRLWGAVYPRNIWWNRVGLALANVVCRVQRSAFRAYVHSPERIDATMRACGFARRSVQRTWIWEVAVYVREGDEQT